MNEKFQNALKRVPQACPPVWFMRQAGRYHQHYQKLRAKHSFMELCKEPELAAQVALGPVEDFDFDVAILFSDLLFPLEAMGMGLTYGDHGPALGWHLTPQNISKLAALTDALPHLQFQKEAVKLTREALPKNKSLIGFVGGPWTLFCYAVQGKHEGGLIESKKNLALFNPFCERLVPLLVKNIELQLQGGAEVVMVFDTAAGELAPGVFKSVVVPQLEKLTQAHPKRLGYYSKTTQPAHLQHDFFKTGVLAGIGVDHRWNMNDAFSIANSGFTQGNFDQALLFGAKDEFLKHLRGYLAPLKTLSAQERAGWVSGLGHGVLPHTPEANVKLFVETVREVFS